MPREREMEFNVKYEAVKEYLNSSRSPSAVYDSRFKLIWSNDDDFFSGLGELKSTLNPSDLPLVKERTISLKSAGKTVPLTLTPYYSDKKLLFYICKAYKNETILELVRKSEIQDAARQFIYSQYGIISHIITVSNAFEHNLDFATSEMKHDSVSKQIASATLLMTQLNTLSLLWDDDEFDEDQISSVSDLYTCVRDECNIELEKIGRKIEGIREYGNSYVALSSKRLTVIVMNLIQNALLYSPPKSGIIFSLKFSSNKAIITVENKTEKTAQNVLRPGLGIPVINNAVAMINGTLKYEESGGNAVAELILPLVKSENYKTLNAKQKEYLHERFKPVRLFLNEVLLKEKPES